MLLAQESEWNGSCQPSMRHCWGKSSFPAKQNIILHTQCLHHHLQPSLYRVKWKAAPTKPPHLAYLSCSFWLCYEPWIFKWMQALGSTVMTSTASVQKAISHVPSKFDLPPLLTCQDPNSEVRVSSASADNIQHLQQRRRELLFPPLLQEPGILSALVGKHRTLDSESAWCVKEENERDGRRATGSLQLQLHCIFKHIKGLLKSFFWSWKLVQNLLFCSFLPLKMRTVYVIICF